MKKGVYKVIIEQDEDGYFVASVPAIPGCYTQAKTMEELRRRVKEVIELCLEEASENPEYQAQIRDFGYNPLFVGLETVTI